MTDPFKSSSPDSSNDGENSCICLYTYLAIDCLNPVTLFPVDDEHWSEITLDKGREPGPFVICLPLPAHYLPSVPIVPQRHIMVISQNMYRNQSKVSRHKSYDITKSFVALIIRKFHFIN